MRKKIVLMVSLLVIFGIVTSAFSQKKPDFPRKSVTVICPWAAGGGTDILLRALAQGNGKISRAIDHGCQHDRRRRRRRSFGHHERKS